MGPITIVGGGNGAHATAGDLALRHHNIRLFETSRYAESIATTSQQAGIRLSGAVSGFARLSSVTTDAGQAIHGADHIVVVAPAFAHEPLTKEIAPHLQPGQSIVFNPGAMGSSIRFRHAIAITRPDLKPDDLFVGETASLTYGARVTSPGAVAIYLVTKNILFAAFPAIDTGRMFARLHSLFPGLIRGRHVFDTGLNNGNPISHPTPTVLNAGHIERFADTFYLYRDGMTPSVVDALEAIDRERISLCQQVGAAVVPVRERIVSWGYARPMPTLHESYSTSPVYSQISGPNSLRLRYLSEDVPFGLVPWASLAHQLGVEAPGMDAVITLAGLLNKTDYRVTGVTMNTMQLGGLSREGLMEYLETGIGV